jgi:hypothetical protein
VVGRSGGLGACVQAARRSLDLIGAYFELSGGHAALEALAQLDVFQWGHQRV